MLGNAQSNKIVRTWNYRFFVDSSHVERAKNAIPTQLDDDIEDNRSIEEIEDDIDHRAAELWNDPKQLKILIMCFII